MAVSSVGPTIIDFVERSSPPHSTAVEPAVLMVLGSQRRPFFEYVYGTSEWEDDVDFYGDALAPIRVEGEHFDMVTRCISNRVPEFTQALEDFLSTDCTPRGGEEDESGDAVD